ncbi:MAG: foldase protein PrsA [Verrucomicrobiota bacterium]
MRTLKLAALVTAACIAGIIAAEFAIRSPVCRDALGKIFGRGDLIALVHGRGIYQADLNNGAGTDDLIVAENIRWLARHEPVAAKSTAREYELLEFQFGDEKTFAVALRANWIFSRCLRATIAAHLRAERWIGNQIASQIKTSEAECRQYYETHRGAFMQPVRYRASHIFLAAPAETDADVVEAKQQLIDSFAKQIEEHVDLAGLAAQFSEDEATKSNGGDLGYFSAARMPPEFFSEVAKLRVGEASPPFRSHLGFHIIRLTDMKPSRELTFDESRAEIAETLEAEKRRAAVERLADGLKMAEYRRSPGQISQ